MRRFLTKFCPGAAGLLFLLCFFLAPVFYIHADEDELEAAGNDAVVNGEATDVAAFEDEYVEELYDYVEELDPELALLEMEIRTSSLMELAAWAREIGISDGGTREELAARLRAHYQLAAPLGEDFVEQRVITIESAVMTEYFTLELVDEDYARFRGGVVISLRDGNAIHRISAGEILFNRTRNVLTASGGVQYVREEGTIVETFRGESITVNLDNWSSIFLDGVSERTMEGQASAYRFAGTIISRDAEGATLLRSAEITNPANEEAFWSITASRLWLLPGNDFAILNAVLWVGNIPLAYIPFFYFPADQVVFRPVLGSRTREGTFLQTTTYILGRPRTEVLTESSIAMIFGGGEGMETQREGIFLRTTGERRQDTDSIRLSLLVDAYVNLGAYVGAALTLPSRGPLGELNVEAGVGFTRDIHEAGGAFTPFPNLDGESEWHRSTLFSADVPFRYRFFMRGSYQVPFGSLSLTFPFYSDPFVDRDFMNRPQPGDWFSMLRAQMEGEDEEAATTDTSIGQYSWSFSGTFNFTLPALRPIIDTLNIQTLNSTMLFNARNWAGYTGPPIQPNPDRSFFVPHQFTVYNIGVLMTGTPFTFASGITRALQPPLPGEFPGTSMLPDIPISPWATDDAEAAEGLLHDEHTFSPPALGQTFQFTNLAGPQLAITYRLNPTSSMQMHFDNSRWLEQDDVDWGQLSSIQTRFSTSGELTFNLTNPGVNAYSATLTFSGTGNLHSFTLLNEEADQFTFASGANAGETNPALVQAQRDSSRTGTNIDSRWYFNTWVAPFFQSPVWGATRFTYRTGGRLAQNIFDRTDGRRWERAWEGNHLEHHQVIASLAANVMDNNQNVTISATLPPIDANAILNASFRKWISTTTINSRVDEPWDDELRSFGAVTITETLTFPTTPAISFSQNIIIEPEDEQVTTLNSRLDIGNFHAIYTLLYTTPWSFNPYFGDPAAGAQLPWAQLPDATPSLEPQNLTFAYNRTFGRDNLWGRRLSFSVNLSTGINFDLQRYTQSSLNFSIGINMQITNFLDLSFNAVSQNAVLFRYFQNMPFFSDLPQDLFPGQETSFFTDLVNSFRFDDPSLRRSSGFKLDRLQVRLIHRLGDWNAMLEILTRPDLDLGDIGRPPSYRFRNDISFLVQWVPIAEIRTEISYFEENLRIR